MTLKVRITKRGANLSTKDGVRQLKVGEELTIQSDTVPGFLINKCQIVSESKGSLEVGESQSSESLEELQKSFKELSGEDADKRWGEARLNEEINKLLAKE